MFPTDRTHVGFQASSLPYLRRLQVWVYPLVIANESTVNALMPGVVAPTATAPPPPPQLLQPSPVLGTPRRRFSQSNGRCISVTQRNHLSLHILAARLAHIRSSAISQ